MTKTVIRFVCPPFLRVFAPTAVLQQLNNTKRLEITACYYDQHNTTETKNYRKLNDTAPSGIEGHLVVKLCMFIGVILV